MNGAWSGVWYGVWFGDDGGDVTPPTPFDGDLGSFPLSLWAPSSFTNGLT